MTKRRIILVVAVLVLGAIALPSEATSPPGLPHVTLAYALSISINAWWAVLAAFVVPYAAMRLVMDFLFPKFVVNPRIRDAWYLAVAIVGYLMFMRIMGPQILTGETPGWGCLLYCAEYPWF